MNDPQRKQMNRRTAWLILLLSAWTGLLVFRLIQLQVVRHEQYKAEVIEQSRNRRPVKPRRGSIFDREGNILARSLPAQAVYLAPAPDETVTDQILKVESLRDILDLTPADLLAIRARIERKEHFIYLKRQVAQEVAGLAKSLGLPGVASHPDTKRVYPNGGLAAHVLGGVDIDDRGQAGVEFALDGALQGRAGEALVLRDARRRRYRLETLQDAEPGKDVVLTLDATIQYIAERELREAVLKSRASWGTIIVSHPASGEVLALANVPAYDPNEFPPSLPGAGINRAVQYNFEPGSTFKIVTAAAALESDAVGPTETFDCRQGTIDIPGKPIDDHKPFGTLNFSEVFIHSSNIGAIRVSRRIGETPLRRMIEAMGFGQRSGVGLPGEEKGIYRPLADWTPRTLPSVAIGYEISVTSIQVLRALNIVANRGLDIPLRVVEHVFDSPEASPPARPAAGRVLSPETADSLTAILERSVEEGTGLAARVEGFRAAGKTGTSQKYDPVLHAYSSERHLASFAGFIPAGDPVLSIIVVIDEPRGAYYGGQVAAPVFSAVAGQVLRHLRVSPRLPARTGVVAAGLAPGGAE